MPRLLGVDIPNNKRVEYALRYIYGIGPTRSKLICEECSIPEPCALPTALHPDVQHGYYKDFSARCQEPTHSFFLFCILSSLVLSIY